MFENFFIENSMKIENWCLKILCKARRCLQHYPLRYELHPHVKIQYAVTEFSFQSPYMPTKD